MSDEIRREVEEELRERLDHTRTRTKIQWRLGRRGAYLVLVGSLFTALGFGYGVIEVPPSGVQQMTMHIKALGLLGISDTQTALTVWGAAWMLSGLVAVITAWWPPGKDAYGFVAIWSFSSVWSVLAFLGEVVYDSPRASLLGVIFGIYAATVLVVSGMTDPPPISRLEEE